MPSGCPWAVVALSLVGILLVGMLPRPGFAGAEQSPTTRTSSPPQDRVARNGQARPGEPARPQPDSDRSSTESRIAKGDITFDDLKFDIEKDEPFLREKLTEQIERLHGKRVKLRGYILPSTLFKETDIDQFVLVRDNQECCFGPGAALFDCVIVEMVPGRTTDFVTRPVTVEGVFKIQEYKYPDGSGHFAVFRIDGERVR